MRPHSGFHCCYNLHMGWPKFVQGSWMATADGGLVALAYGSTEVTTLIGGTVVRVVEDTDYPFADVVRISLHPEGAVRFPLRLRVPAWARAPRLRVNGEPMNAVPAGQFVTLDRLWQAGDEVVLELPAGVEVRQGLNGTATLLRGPLVFSLRLEQRGRSLAPRHDGSDEVEYEAGSPWNFALALDGAPESGIAVRRRAMPSNPWLPETAPITLDVIAKRLPGWTLDAGGILAQEPPPSPVDSVEPPERIALVPFGAQTLRISAFPILRPGSLHAGS